MSEYYKIKEDMTDLQNALQLLKLRTFKIISSVIEPAKIAKTYIYTIYGASEISVDISVSSDIGYSVKINDKTKNVSCRFATFTLPKGRNNISVIIESGVCAIVKFSGNGIKMISS